MIQMMTISSVGYLLSSEKDSEASFQGIDETGKEPMDTLGGFHGALSLLSDNKSQSVARAFKPIKWIRAGTVRIRKGCTVMKK